jgi:hypothetical protein
MSGPDSGLTKKLDIPPPPAPPPMREVRDSTGQGYAVCAVIVILALIAVAVRSFE